MATTLPELTRKIDNAFVTTWYEIRPQAIDNILDATVVWAALKGKGSFTPQVGGEFITRTVRYGKETAKEVAKGDIFSQGETELETMARWTWRYLSAHVQRSLFDDQKNNGRSKIKDLVGMRLNAAKEAMEEDYETKLLRPITTDESGKGIQGLNDIVPPYADRATGTYGQIARSNPWWQPKYRQVTAPKEVNLLTDMKVLYNDCHNNQVPPDLIISSKENYEIYEEFALDISQIVKDESSYLADLGFEVLRFKGKPLVWTPNQTEGMLFLNTNFIEVVYDPQLWFDMTDFKPIPLQGERIAHIVSAANVISSQLRRHGRLYE